MPQDMDMILKYLLIKCLNSKFPVKKPYTHYFNDQSYQMATNNKSSYVLNALRWIFLTYYCLVCKLNHENEKKKKNRNTK